MDSILCNSRFFSYCRRISTPYITKAVPSVNTELHSPAIKNVHTKQGQIQFTCKIKSALIILTNSIYSDTEYVRARVCVDSKFTRFV